MLARIGYARLPAITPFEYVAQLSATLPSELSSLLPAIEAVTLDFVEVRYGKRSLPESRISASTAMLEEFARSIKGFRMMRLLTRMRKKVGQ